jgi:branched-chain amino acid transport system substrate-binding protein
MRLRFAAVGAIGSIVCLLAGSLARPAVAADPFEIDMITSLTGQAAFLGNEEAATMQTIADIVNKGGGIGGRPIRFVVSDDQSNPQIALQLVQGVIAKRAPVMVGPTITAACGAVMPVLEDGPADYCLSPGVHPPEGSYMFSAAFSTVDACAALIHYLRQRGWTKIAMITSIDATGQDAERNVDAALALPQNSGASIVDREHFNVTDISVAAQMAHIKSSDAQAVVAWATGTPFSTLVRGIHDAGIDLPVATSNGNLTFQQLSTNATFLPKELYFAGIPSAATAAQLPRGPTKDAQLAYVNAFKAIGVRAEIGQYQAWDAGWIVVAALRKLGLGATGGQVRDYIAGLQGWYGVNGAYDFRAYPQRGIGMSTVNVVRWDAGNDTWIPVSKPGGEPIK